MDYSTGPGMDAITQSLDDIVAGSTTQCQELLRHVENDKAAIINAIKNDDFTAPKIIQAIIKVSRPEPAHQKALVSVCKCICSADADCTDILLDHGLVQALQLLLEHVVLGSSDEQLRLLALDLIHAISFDAVRGFARSGRILASKRFCKLLGNFIRNECARLDSSRAQRIACLLKSSFQAQSAHSRQAAEDLDRKFGNIVAWLVDHYTAQTSGETMALLLTTMIGGHEYIVTKVAQSGAIEQMVKRAQGDDEASAKLGLVALWGGSDGLPGARHLLQHCDVLLTIVQKNAFGSMQMHNCIGILANFTRCK